MPMGTTTEPNRNERMATTTPGQPMPPPGWAGTQDVDKPFLPEEFDRVLLMRCYPEANSTEELRSIAYAAGQQALDLARASRASVDVVEEPEAAPAPAPKPADKK